MSSSASFEVCSLYNFLLINLNLYLNILLQVVLVLVVLLVHLDDRFWHCGLSLGRSDIFGVEQGVLKQL